MKNPHLPGPLLLTRKCHSPRQVSCRVGGGQWYLGRRKGLVTLDSSQRKLGYLVLGGHVADFVTLFILVTCIKHEIKQQGQTPYASGSFLWEGGRQQGKGLRHKQQSLTC